MLPAAVVEALPPSARVVEVGVGSRFEALEDLQARRPAARLVAVDVKKQAVEGAPEGIEARVDDVHEPRVSIYRGADLVFARRPPVELQRAIARLAVSADSSLALRALKDEWADLEALVGPHEVPDSEESWRWWSGSHDR